MAMEERETFSLIAAQRQRRLPDENWTVLKTAPRARNAYTLLRPTITESRPRLQGASGIGRGRSASPFGGPASLSS